MKHPKDVNAEVVVQPPESVLSRIWRVVCALWFMLWITVAGTVGLMHLDVMTGKTTVGSRVFCALAALLTAYAMSRMLTWRKRSDAKPPH